MSRLDIRWNRLRGALLSLALCCCSAAAVLLGSHQYLKRAQAEYEDHRTRLDAVVHRYRAAEHDRAVYAKYADRYAELTRQGVIGEEPRLKWVEALERINQGLRLPMLRYEIQPRTLVSATASRANEGVLRLFRSSMTLDMGLLHEGELLALLAQLRRSTGGRFEVRRCDMRLASVARGIAFDVRQPNLLAVCVLDWYSLKLEPDTAGDGAQS